MTNDRRRAEDYLDVREAEGGEEAVGHDLDLVAVGGLEGRGRVEEALLELGLDGGDGESQGRAVLLGDEGRGLEDVDVAHHGDVGQLALERLVEVVHELLLGGGLLGRLALGHLEHDVRAQDEQHGLDLPVVALLVLAGPPHEHVEQLIGLAGQLGAVLLVGMVWCMIGD